MEGEDPGEKGRSEWTCKCTNTYSTCRSNQSMGPKSRGLISRLYPLFFCSITVERSILTWFQLYYSSMFSVVLIYFRYDFKTATRRSLEIEREISSKRTGLGRKHLTR